MWVTSEYCEEYKFDFINPYSGFGKSFSIMLSYLFIQSFGLGRFFSCSNYSYENNIFLITSKSYNFFRIVTISKFFIIFFFALQNYLCFNFLNPKIMSNISEYEVLDAFGCVLSSD